MPDVSQREYMLKILVKREFLIRYKDSLLGLLWIFGAPLVMMVTYSAFVFGLLHGVKKFAAADLAGLWVCLGLWQWFSESVSRSTTAFHDNSTLVKKTNVDLALLPLTNVIVSMVGFSLPLVMAVGLSAIYGEWLAISHLLLGVLIFMPWFIGIVYISSTVGTFLRDARYAVPMIVNVSFFMTPILYTMADIGGVLKRIVSFNPVAPIFDFTKHFGTMTTHDQIWLGCSGGLGLLVMFGGLTMFKARMKEIPDVV